MAIDPVKYWQFKAETKRHIAELRKKLHDVSVNGGGGSGGGGGTDIDLSDYATMRWVESQGYAKSADLSDYALASQIPTKVSQLTNDANYLKSSSTPLAFSVYALNVRSSLSLRAYSSSAPDDAPDIGFFSYSNEEIGRIYKPAGIERFYVRFGSNKPSYSLAFTSDLEPITEDIAANAEQIEHLNEKAKEIADIRTQGKTNASNIAKNTTSIADLAKTIEGDEEILGDLSIAVRNLENAGYITAEALQPYAKTADLSKFALKTEIPTNNNQLSNGAGYVTGTQLNGYGYATEAWVNSQLTNRIPTNNSQLTNGEGYIKGIDSAMVIEALNYTPFNAANFTKANIKNTLGIADWALGSAKPTYSWSEIQSRPTALSQFSNDVGYITASAKVSSAYSADESNKLLAQYLAKSDANTLGVGAVFGWVNISTGASHIPTAGNLISFEDNSLCATQFLSKYDGTATYTRIKKQSDKTWSSWVQLAYKSHIPTRLSQLTDDMVAGHYLPLTGGAMSGALSVPSITIGGVTISAQNGAITVNGSLLATGDITGGV